MTPLDMIVLVLMVLFVVALLTITEPRYTSADLSAAQRLTGVPIIPANAATLALLRCGASAQSAAEAFAQLSRALADFNRTVGDRNE
jgi:hypothetical protein